jgi:hypothetical protein
MENIMLEVIYDLEDLNILEQQGDQVHLTQGADILIMLYAYETLFFLKHSRKRESRQYFSMIAESGLQVEQVADLITRGVLKQIVFRRASLGMENPNNFTEDYVMLMKSTFATILESNPELYNAIKLVCQPLISDRQ